MPHAHPVEIDMRGNYERDIRSIHNSVKECSGLNVRVPSQIHMLKS